MIFSVLLNIYYGIFYIYLADENISYRVKDLSSQNIHVSFQEM